MKVNNFNDVAKNTLDEWIYFLKNSEVKEGFKAKGLDKAKEKLRYETLSEDEKKMYDRFQENRRIELSVEYTAQLEAEHKKALEIAKKLINRNLSNEDIAEDTGLSIAQIIEIRSK